MSRTTRRSFLKTAVATGGTAAMLAPAIRAQEKAPFRRIVYRDLGSTGHKVSEVGFGCMNMRDPELVEAAIDAGINYLDTAFVYQNGGSEEAIGEIMQTKRNKVFLTTKVGLNTGMDEVPRQIETSLKRLKTDHVDLLLLHHGGDTSEMVLDPARMKVLEDARKRGQTRFVGFSTHTSDPAIYDNALKAGFWEAVLLCYNYQSPPALTASIAKVRAAGMAVIAMKNLINFEAQPRSPLPDIRTAGSTVSKNQAHLKWVLSNPNIDTIIPGMSSFEHLAEDLAIMGEKLSSAERRLLRQWSEGIKGSHCLHLAGCTGCAGQCPKGVDICEINRCLGYEHGYHDHRLAMENYRLLPAASRVEACADCSECAVKCANGLDLTATVRQARALFA